MSDHLDADRQQAMRLMLTQPILTDAHPGYRNALSHVKWLETEFQALLGYRLVRGTGWLRLRKAPPAPDGPVRPLMRRTPAARRRRHHGQPFARRDYAALSLVCAALSRHEQVLLTTLMADVAAAAAEASIAFDVRLPADRRGVFHALWWLVELGVVAEVEASTGYREGDQDAEALLDVRRELLDQLVVAPVAGRDAPDIIAHAWDREPADLRLRIRRRLVEQPVVLRDDLAPDERTYLSDRQRQEEERWAERLGAEVEIRAEGLAIIDTTDDLSDLFFPRDAGRVGHAALLILSALASKLRSGNRASGGWVPVTAQEITTAVTDLAVAHPGTQLAHGIDEDPAAFVADVVEVLSHAGLLRPAQVGFELCAAASRYASTAQAPAPPPPPPIPLFPDSQPSHSQPSLEES